MKELLSYLVEQIVDHPEKVSIEERELGERTYHYVIKTDTADTGKVIGKGGKVIAAIRSIAKILAIKDSIQIRIEIGQLP